MAAPRQDWIELPEQGGGDSPPFGQEVLSWGGRGRVEGGAGLQHGAGDVEEAIGH